MSDTTYAETVITEAMQAKIDAVREHAVENYSREGWDFVVEHYSDVALAEIIGNRRGKWSAIEAVAAVVKDFDDLRTDVQATAF